MKYAIALAALISTQAGAWNVDGYGLGYIGPQNNSGSSVYIQSGQPNVYRFDNDYGSTYMQSGQPNVYRFDNPYGSTYLQSGQPNVYRFDY